MINAISEEVDGLDAVLTEIASLEQCQRPFHKSEHHPLIMHV
jgi:hypothetical protein